MRMKDYIEVSFTYHAPKNKEQIDKYTYLRNEAKALAHVIDEQCPDSLEKTRAIQKLEEAVMWANAAIARWE